VLAVQQVEQTHIVLGMLRIAFIRAAAIYGMLPLKITEEILHRK